MPITFYQERSHAQKLIDYMAKRGGRVNFMLIPQPPHQEWTSALNILETTLEMEKEVNQSLLNLHRIAEEQDDPALEDFLEGEFLSEQVDDIKRAADYVTELRRCGGEGLGLYLFDRKFLDEHSQQ